MADVNPLFLREEELRHGLALLERSERLIARDSDALLRGRGLGRSHYRTLTAIAARPGLTVGALLEELDITKQSLGRLLAPLGAQGLVRHRAGDGDRRQRHLELTDAGHALERDLVRLRQARLATAYRQAGPVAVSGFRRVLEGLVAGEGGT